MLLGGLLAGAGCVPAPEERMPLAVRRATRDLGCEERRLTGRYLGNRLFRVNGCGRQATYRVICKLTVHTCELIGGPDDDPPRPSGPTSGPAR